MATVLLDYRGTMIKGSQGDTAEAVQGALRYTQDGFQTSLNPNVFITDVEPSPEEMEAAYPNVPYFYLGDTFGSEWTFNLNGANTTVAVTGDQSFPIRIVTHNGRRRYFVVTATPVPPETSASASLQELLAKGAKGKVSDYRFVPATPASASSASSASLQQLINKGSKGKVSDYRFEPTMYTGEIQYQPLKHPPLEERPSNYYRTSIDSSTDPLRGTNFSQYVYQAYPSYR